ncbi:MAG: TetR/AcrR family transcriptional regulator [Spirochaetaceae bacterium]|nr:TetR/AcrR family transcriptional regulator [Spirochaetaceae bacterium]
MPKPNRKIRYTKMVLRDSLINLIKEKSILRITIKDICDIADISRSTFYAHYKDQYDLLRQIQEETIANLESLFAKYNSKENKKNITRMTEEVLRYIADNESIQVLISENGDSNFQKKLFSFSQKQVLRYYPTPAHVTSDDKIQTYVSAFVVSGSIRLIQQWLKSNMDVPVHEMAKMMVWLSQR